MSRMYSWMVMFWVIIGVQSVSSETDHNEKEHHALCEFLKVAVDKWKEVKARKPEDPLRKALKDTIFGYGGVEEDLETLKTTLPRDYDKVGEEGSSRSNWCGQPLSGEYQESYPRWPGQSAPHDMVCLCTAGSHGWPINETGKLCAQGKDALSARSQWWSGTNNTEKKDAIQKTWKIIVKQCLSESIQKQDLKKTLQTFKDKIQRKIEETETYYVLGENGTDYLSNPCDGSPKNGLCVKYYPTYKETQTWWKDLGEAIEKDEQLQKQRQEETEEQKEEAEQHSPKTEALNSGHPTTNQTEQNRNDNITNQLRRFNLTSGTFITPPSSWLLSALLLI
ncbi:Variant surface glycoprotein [Trypanosoma congolense IL3000]|uniref:Variant surface glycoprotein n=1 Tax=Trypanosoma congolense (strain IL3000) TaxID=1068625 RepID=F9WEX8_TRYCI|nr:Variant surface glycoprotein [Trypanosoma congolense IL3000]